MSIFDEFDKAYDSKSMKEDVKKAAENRNDYEEIPTGTYACYIKEMEVKASKKNEPMLAIQCKITDGKYKNQILFAYFMLTKPFLIHKCNEFLRSLETDIDVEFDSYGQYADTVADIKTYLDTNEVDLDVEYSLRDGKYSEYKVTGVYAN